MDAFRIVSLKEYAELMHVCPNTVRNWMETGRLTAGDDYFQEGKTIRFIWSEAAILRFMRRNIRSSGHRPNMQSQRGNRRTLTLRA